MIPLSDNLIARRAPLAVWLLVAVNLSVFLFELLLGSHRDLFITNFGLIPLEVSRRANLPESHLVSPAISSFTALFLHASFMHVLSNMLFLWVFGRGVENALGSIRFLAFYLVGGYLGHLGHYLAYPSSAIPVVGASGAIAAVMGAYLSLYPNARIKTLIPIFIYPWITDIPAFFFLFYWFVLQMFSGLGSLGAPSEGVAWWAHIGGFIFGLLYLRRFRRRHPHGRGARRFIWKAP